MHLGNFDQAEFLHHRLPHLAFSCLARRSDREGIDETHVARNLLMGNLPLAKLADIFLARLAIGFSDDPRAEFLTVLLVRNSEDLDISDGRMTKQILLDFAREEILSAPNDHILDSPNDLQIARVVEYPEVSGMHPTVFDSVRGLFGFIPVSQHNRVATHADLPMFVALYDGATFIDDFHLDVGMHAADRGNASFQAIVYAGLKRDRTGLRHAVRNRYFGQAHVVYQAYQHLDRSRRTGNDSGSKAGKVALLERRVIHFRDEHRRNAIQRRATLRFDRPQHFTGVKPFARQQHRRRMANAPQHAHYHSERMEQWHRYAKSVSR